MEFRLGTCGDCSAKYKLPATFSANRAKCKKCGGVVEIGAVQRGAGSAGKSPAPAARAAGEKGAAKVPARVPGPGKKPAPVPARTPTKAVKAAPSQKGAVQKIASSGKQAAAAGNAAADGAQQALRKGAAKVAGAAAVASSATPKSARPAGASRGSARPARGARASERRSSRSGARPEKKKNGMLIGGGLVGVAVVIGGALFFMNRGDESAQAAEKDQVASLNATPEASAEAIDAAAKAPQAQAQQEPGAETEAAGEELAQEADAAGEESKEAMPEGTPKPVVDNIDLSELPELEPFAGTTEEELLEMQQWMVSYVDPDAGAAGNRAGLKLQEKGRAAFPIILNSFKRQDFASESGYRTGDLVQKLLEKICNGNNFGWKYSSEPADVVFNKKVVRAWFNAWDQAKDNDTAWTNLAKLNKSDEAEKSSGAELEDF